MIFSKKNYVNFNDDNDTSGLSYKNRVESLKKYNKFIFDEVLYRHGFNPSDNARKFLKLKIKTAILDDVVPSALPASAQSQKFPTKEMEMISENVDTLRATEYVQMFLDSYISPVNSDIRFRLGEVTGTKVFNCDYENGTVIYDDDEDNLDSLAQYDKYGRLDTTVNFRKITHIEGVGTVENKWWDYDWSTNRYFLKSNSANVVQPYDEYYVNWFFPPFKNTAFAEGGDASKLSSVVDQNIRNRKWNKDHWEYIDDDIDKITYDKKMLLCLRDKPTYRNIAYKPLNDNINYLQHIFEMSTGIVSTYLTEWDISLYIQEGLLSSRDDLKPTVISLNNRVFKDNPAGYNDSRAFSFGVLNGAVSKTPLEGGVPSNTAQYMPSAYPLSTYWWPYDSIDRGDGLDKFYDVAKKGFVESEFIRKTTREKIRWYDDVGAAYSGWYNWDKLYNWNALFTWGDDGFSPIDLIHMGESTEELTFNTRGSGEDEETGEIDQIIETLYSEDDSLGYPSDEWDEETSFTDDTSEKNIWKLVKHFKRNTTSGAPVFQYAIKSCVTDPSKESLFFNSEDDLNNGRNGSSQRGDGSFGGAGDIRIMGIPIPGSSLLKMFLKKGSIKGKAMGIAKKSKGGYSNADSSSSSSHSGGTSGSNGGSFSETINGNGNGEDNNGNNGETPINMMGNNEDGGCYSRHEGVSQWSPMIYGGPHGASYSPKTVQGFFEQKNQFLRNIPRMDFNKSKNDIRNSNFLNAHHNDFFQGNEAYYDQTFGRDRLNLPNASRSPTKCLNLLNKGYMDYTTYPVYCLKKYYVTVPANRRLVRRYNYFWWWDRWYYEYYKPTYWNGHYLYYIDDYYYTERWSSTYYVTPYSRVCMNYNRCPHVYGTGWYEWDNYYSYASWNEYYYKDYWGSRYSGWSWWSYYWGYYGTYRLNKVSSVRNYRAYYYDWVWMNYKRPLMHSDIDNYWSINRTFRRTITTSIVRNNFWNRFWHNFCAWWSGGRYMEATRYVYTSNPPEEVFRLTFPKSWYTDWRSVIQLSGANYPYTRTYLEREFIEKVLGNTTSRKHKVLFFASTNSEDYRNKYGPDLIFSADCWLESYNYKYRTQHWYRYKHRCHHDWDWYWDEAVATAWFIRVDLNSRTVEDFSLSGFRPEVDTEPYSNLESTKSLAKDDNEMKKDVPPESSRAPLYGTPISFESDVPMSDHVRFAGYALNQGTENGFHGWGYTTTMPGMHPEFHHDSSNAMENPNEYLNMSYMFGNYTVENLSFQSLLTYKRLPFYRLSPNAPAMYPTRLFGENIVYACGVMGYERCPNTPKMRGLINALKNLYTSSTFFKLNESDAGLNSKPCIVKNDCMLRTAVRSAIHQKAYLKEAKDVFLEDIDFGYVTEMIEKKIDKDILNKTLKKSPKRDTQSILYHYWIDEAYEFFSDSSNKALMSSNFDKKIKYIDEFIDKTRHLLNKTIDTWSYNDLIKSFEYLRFIQEKFLDDTGNRNNSVKNIEDFMYMYLSVLYEYRKYFINKRCNKIDGTLWALRELESAIPMIVNVPSKLDESNENTDIEACIRDIHQYKVDYYRVSNSNSSKVATAISNDRLEKDKTMMIYIKVKYISETQAKEYLDGIKDGTWNESEKGRFIYIEQNQRWAELPFDDEYRYLSKEYTQALADKAYNKKMLKVAEKNNTTPELRTISNLIDGLDDNKCVFHINWSTQGGLKTVEDELLKGNKFFHLVETKTGYTPVFTEEKKKGSKPLTLTNFLDMRERFPFVYKKQRGTDALIDEKGSIPAILFDVAGGINLTKVKTIMTVKPQEFGKNALNDICSIQETDDYWSILIPTSARPRVVGYMSGLSIKTNIPKVEDPEIKTATKVATATGSFGYALYPITEEQANTLPSVGASLEGLGNTLKDSLTNNIK